MIWCGPASRSTAGSLSSRGNHDFAPVVHLKGRILQVRDVSAGETVGYGATRTLTRPSRVAIVSVGYADGFFRSLSTKDGEVGFVAYAGGHAAPILGRVSMDLITVDVTDVPEPLLGPRRMGRADGTQCHRADRSPIMPAPSTTRC